MSPPNRQDVPQISRELGIHRSTLYQWRSNWRLQGDVVPASEKDPDISNAELSPFVISHGSSCKKVANCARFSPIFCFSMQSATNLLESKIFLGRWFRQEHLNISLPALHVQFCIDILKRHYSERRINRHEFHRKISLAWLNNCYLRLIYYSIYLYNSGASLQ